MELNKYEYWRNELRARNTLKPGKRLLIAGGTIVVTGLALVGIGVGYLNINRNSTTGLTGMLTFSIGTFLLVPGTGLSVAGAILTARGLKYRRKANEIKPNLSFNPILFSPTQFGAGQARGMSPGLELSLSF
jgi:hypothetical protein